MKKLLVCLACLLLSGCASLPRPREMENMALLRTLGVDRVQGEYILTASTGPGPENAGALVLEGRGTDFPSAVEDLKGNSSSTVFLGYVDQLLVSEGDLLPVLDYAARDGELSLGARLWFLRDTTAALAVASGGRDGVEKRLNTLRLNGAPTRSAGEVFSDLLDLGEAELPALRLEGDALYPDAPVREELLP